MENHTENLTGTGISAAQILSNLTLAQAYAHSATADKAAYVVELLGVKSIHSPLFVEMEDAIEERFHELRVADNRNEWHKVSAVRNIDRLIFGGQCERGEFDNLTAYAVADQLRDAVCAFFRDPSKSNAFRVFDLRGTHQRTGTIDIAFSRIAEVYRFHCGPYYQTESGAD